MDLLRQARLTIWVLIMSFGVVGIACHSARPVEVKSAEGRFSVWFPPGFQPPKYEMKALTEDGQPLPLHTVAVESQESVCLVAYSDYPPQLFDLMDPQSVMESVLNGAIGQLDGVVERQEALVIQGLPASSVLFSATKAGQKIYGRYVYIVARPRLYQIACVSGNRAEIEKPAINQFFQSFKPQP